MAGPQHQQNLEGAKTYMFLAKILPKLLCLCKEQMSLRQDASYSINLAN